MKLQTIAHFVRIERLPGQFGEQAQLDRTQQSLGAPKAKTKLHDFFRCRFVWHEAMRNRRESIGKDTVRRSQDTGPAIPAVPFLEAPTTTYTTANILNQYPTIGEAGATYDNNGNLVTYNDWTYTYDSMNWLTLASTSRWGHGFARQEMPLDRQFPILFPFRYGGF